MRPADGCRWITTGEGEPGVSWCALCVDRGAAHAGGAEWVAWEAGWGGRQGPPAWRAGLQLRASAGGGCPLCGVGELSSEHLLVWCWAARQALEQAGVGAPVPALAAGAGGRVAQALVRAWAQNRIFR